MKKYLAPSILSSDFSKLGSELKILEDCGLTYVHLDVMDGTYVPNISFGIPVIESIRPNSSLIFDTHLMVKNPDHLVEGFANAGSDIITIHGESTIHLSRSIQLVKYYGKKVGVSLNPSTPLHFLEYVIEDIDLILLMSVNPGFGGQKYISQTDRKIRKLAQFREENNLDFMISVDGGIKLDNVERIMDLGADLIVAGSAVYADTDEETIKNIEDFKKLGLS